MGTIQPLARSEGLSIEEIDGQFRVVDEAREAACVLNATALLVWRNCDGRRSLAELTVAVSEKLGVAADEDMVLMALDKLAEHGLLVSGYEQRDHRAERLSRRRFFRRAGIASVTAMAAPVVYSAAAPSVAFAASYYSY